MRQRRMRRSRGVPWGTRRQARPACAAGAAAVPRMVGPAGQRLSPARVYHVAEYDVSVLGVMGACGRLRAAKPTRHLHAGGRAVGIEVQSVGPAVGARRGLFKPGRLRCRPCRRRRQRRHEEELLHLRLLRPSLLPAAHARTPDAGPCGSRRAWPRRCSRPGLLLQACSAVRIPRHPGEPQVQHSNRPYFPPR